MGSAFPLAKHTDVASPRSRNNQPGSTGTLPITVHYSLVYTVVLFIMEHSNAHVYHSLPPCKLNSYCLTRKEKHRKK